MSHNPLGQQTQYIAHYAPELLFPIARSESRQQLAMNERPFYGVDVWTGYELSWLNAQGKPIVAVAEFFFPCASPNIVESKSFKLYLNSLNQTRFENIQNLTETLVRDLSLACGASVEVKLYSAQHLNEMGSLALGRLSGDCLDDLALEIDTYHPQPEFLVADNAQIVSQTWHSHLLKSNCPVTGQPDWASVSVSYQGAKISPEGLLRYIVSFREHQDFHENCVERMFNDILQRCAPERLTVFARYTRRGGLDINPIRSTEQNFNVEPIRLIRQ